MNHDCHGVEFDRWGKHWLICFYDSKVMESPAAPAKCPNCERPWSPVPYSPSEVELLEEEVGLKIDLPYYKTRTAELEAALKNLTDAGEWALRGLEHLSKDEAARKDSTPELCDYTFAKALRAALAGAPRDFGISPAVMKILHAFKRGTPLDHKFCNCVKCHQLYEAMRAYPVYAMTP